MLLTVQQLKIKVDLKPSVNNKQTLVRAKWCLLEKKILDFLQRYFKTYTRAKRCLKINRFYFYLFKTVSA